jgi:hypothetical protein
MRRCGRRHIRTRTHTHIYTHTLAYTHTHTHNLSTYVRTHTHVYVHTHTHVYVRTHTHAHLALLRAHADMQQSTCRLHYGSFHYLSGPFLVHVGTYASKGWPKSTYGICKVLHVLVADYFKLLWSGMMREKTPRRPGRRRRRKKSSRERRRGGAGTLLVPLLLLLQVGVTMMMRVSRPKRSARTSVYVCVCVRTCLCVCARVDGSHCFSGQ